MIDAHDQTWIDEAAASVGDVESEDWSLTPAEIRASEDDYRERNGLRLSELDEMDHLSDAEFNAEMDRRHGRIN